MFVNKRKRHWEPTMRVENNARVVHKEKRKDAEHFNVGTKCNITPSNAKLEMKRVKNKRIQTKQ